MNLLSETRIRPKYKSTYSGLLFLLVGLGPREALGKGGGAHDSDNSAKKSSSSGSSGGSSSSGYRGSSSQPVIINTGHNTCIDQDTGQIVACPPPQHLSTGAIVGIVLGSIAGALLLGTLIWFIIYQYRQRRRERSRSSPREPLLPTKQNPYQPLDGHVHPEGAGTALDAQKSTPSAPAYVDPFARSSMVMEEDEEKYSEGKRTVIPEPEPSKGCVIA